MLVGAGATAEVLSAEKPWLCVQAAGTQAETGCPRAEGQHTGHGGGLGPPGAAEKRGR